MRARVSARARETWTGWSTNLEKAIGLNQYSPSTISQTCLQLSKSWTFFSVINEELFRKNERVIETYCLYESFCHFLGQIVGVYLPSTMLTDPTSVLSVEIKAVSGCVRKEVLSGVFSADGDQS